MKARPQATEFFYPINISPARETRANGDSRGDGALPLRNPIAFDSRASSRDFLL